MKRIESLDGLKTIAFLLVFVSHIPRLNFAINPFGVAGVSIFFVCSGFFAYYTNCGKSIGGGVYCLRRFLQKSYTLHLVTFIAAAIIQQFWMQRWFSVAGFWDAIKRAIPNLLLVQSLIPDANYYYGFNSVSWYLSSLAILHLLLPLFLKLIKSIPNITQGLVSVIFLYIGISKLISMFEINQKWIFYISPIMRSFDYMIGMILAKNYISGNKSERGNNISAVIGIVLFIIALIVYGHVPSWLSYSLIFIPGTVLIVYGIINGERKSFLIKCLSCKFFYYSNTISLELYLTHQIIINYVESYNVDMGRISNFKYYLLIILGTFLISFFIKFVRSAVAK